MTPEEPLKYRARDFFKGLQDRICSAVEKLDQAAQFRDDLWEREGGGGGRTRVLLEGGVFEKAGVNFSEVYGEFTQPFADRLPVGEGLQFFAIGVSLVLHPLNPYVPTVHANFRYLERGSGGWFGGGSDLTPYYPFLEDVVHFHQTLKSACDRFDAGYYPAFKKWCDEYFFLKHRDETRGVGGLFFDYTPWLIVAGVVAFGSAVQIPGVGGGMQVATVLILTEFFRIPLETAGGIALLMWVVAFVAIVPFGVVLALQQGLQWGKLAHTEDLERI